MPTESIFTKRRARYAGEMGLFADNPMAGDDLALASEGEELIFHWHSPRNLEALKFLWALVDKVSQNTDRYIHKDEAMKDLKLRAGFTKIAYNSTTKELELRPKSLTRINNQKLRLLTEKITDIVCTEILPGMKRNDLRREVEEMLQPRTQSAWPGNNDTLRQ